MEKKGLYVVFEGPDGSGKSVQAQKIVERMKKIGLDTIHYREPGGELGKQNTIGEKIRALLQDKENHINAMCELLLFTANRAQLIDEIKEYTNQGVNVICERNFLSSIVYQGYGRGIDIDLIINVTQLFVDKLPDLVILYKVNTQEGLQRVTNRGEKDRIENESKDFHFRVFEGYESLKSVCDKLGIPCVIINTTDKKWDEYEESVLREIIQKQQS
ncbi:dTMP kinase [Petroclostridium sp. X23]|uniref:dTMP kinase n=1 Tax=Petroclostridium sp. X23 TaxID=3045146 RepID=UPI0024AE60F7|nr:dTMP kinase [Petroclostridium sp. X23]WHH60702.1 dTMP kinase [Petroclostridium sp. X23]